MSSLLSRKDLESIINKENIKLKDKLTKGGFGEIYQVTLEQNLTAIMKILHTKKTKKHRIKQYTSEASISLNLKSHYIVRTKDVFQREIKSQSVTGILMEYCTYKDLKTMIHYIHETNIYNSLLFTKEKNCINSINFLKNPSENMIRLFFMNIVYGLEFLYRSNIIHLDLKPENIFISDNMKARLGDFGLSRFINLKDKFFPLVESTHGYMGKEYKVKLIDENPKVQTKLASKVDYYPLGCCLYYFIFGEKYYGNKRKLWNSNIISQQLKLLISRCLDTIKNRPNIYQILNNNWICTNFNQIKEINDKNGDDLKFLLEMQKINHINNAKGRKGNKFILKKVKILSPFRE